MGSPPLIRHAAVSCILLVALALSATPHRASTPPDLGSASAALSWNSGTGDLSWYYTHPGDYNQDGLVTVSDITPLGQNFGAEGPFSIGSALSMVDGNGDGFITVSDITPIGQNFGKQVVTWGVYQSGSAADYPTTTTGANGGGATLLDTVLLADAPLTAGQRRQYVVHLDAPPAGGFGWVRPLDAEQSPGTPSNMISFGSAGGNAAPVADLSADPAIGDVPLSVSFNAGGSSDSDGQIVHYSWDFNSDTFIDLAGASAQVQHTYTVGGLYTARVWALDDQGGQDSDSVHITVAGSTGQPPVAQLSVIPARAAPGTTVVLHSAGSSDPEGGDLRYSFDPEGDGTFKAPDTDMSLNWTYTVLGDFQPALRVFDEDGQFDDASGSLEISLGTLEKHVIDQQAGDEITGSNVGLIVADGKPGIAYYDASAELGLTLRWCGAKDAAGSEWWDQRALGRCDGTFGLGLAADHPCIAYVKDSDLHYMRADDADGNGDWELDRPIIDAAAHSESGRVLYPSLTTVGGHPAVTCNNGDALFGGDALYIRASNATGSVWPIAARTIVYVENHVAFFTALREVNGRPAMAYHGGLLTGSWIRFVRSYDTEGISWPQVPVDLTPMGDFRLGGSSLEIVSGRPAVAFWNVLDEQVLFARALDSDGTDWAPPLNIASVPNVQSSIDLAVVNGLPCIAYSDSGVGLYLVVAADFAGRYWNEPVLVDSGGLVGLSVKLADIEGRAGLAYYNHSRENIEFAVYR